MYQCAVLAFLCLCVSGFGKLPKPSNVRMDSVNFLNILRWNPPRDFSEEEFTYTVTYTVQYRLDFNKRSAFNVVCVTQNLECDLSYITYRSYVRVGAAVGDKQSDWETIIFDPYNDTVIGPPEVLVSSRSGHLDISISGPYDGSKSKKDSIKSKYGELLYTVLYWKQEDPDRVLTLNTSQTTEILTNLEPWTVYCLTVHAYIPEYDRKGESSPLDCVKTTDDGRTPWWQTAGVFLVMMLFTMTAVLGLYFLGTTTYKRYLSFPSYSIPEHLKEYLSKPFSSTPNLQTQPSEECGESCEPLTFLSEEPEGAKEQTT